MNEQPQVSPTVAWLRERLHGGPVPAIEVLRDAPADADSLSLLKALHELGGTRIPGTQEWALPPCAQAAEAVAMAPPALTLAEITRAAALEERARIRDICQSDAAHGRTALAHHIALETTMTVEAAVAILASSPPAQQAPNHDQFSEHMARLGLPLTAPNRVDVAKFLQPGPAH